MALTLAQMQANHKNKLQQGTTLGQTNNTAAPQYKKSDYTQGWGVGYDTGNVSGGFNKFNDFGAVQNEINRMNTVMQNREKFGMQNTNEHTSYLDRLNQSIKPYTESQNKINDAQNAWNTQLGQYKTDWNSILQGGKDNTQSWRDSYENSQARADYNAIQNATIQDIGNKYGFDFSKDYATKQAEAEAQALRDANANAQRQNESLNKQNNQRIENNIMSAVEALDRNYFQQGLGMGQDQVESGLNAGIAADQALRLQMGRQAEMGDVYRDANLGRMTEDQRFTNEGLRLTEGLGTINQQALANAEKLFQQLQMQGYDILSNDRNFYAQQDQQEWARSQAEIDRAGQNTDRDLGALQWMMGFDQQNLQNTIGNEQWAQQFFQNNLQNSMQNQQWQTQFDYNKGRDQVADKQWQTQFDYGVGRDQVADKQWQSQFDWGKIMDEAGLTGLYNGQNTWDRTQGQFNMDMAEKEFAFKQQQAAIDNALRQAAVRSSGGGSSGGTKTSTTKTTAKTSYDNLYDRYQKETNQKLQTLANRTQSIMDNSPAAQLAKQQQFVRDAMLKASGYTPPRTFGK